MATTFEDAARAKSELRLRLGRPRWLRGVGIGRDAEGHFVKVNVAEMTLEVMALLPHDVSGVRIRVEVVGDVVAQSFKP